MGKEDMRAGEADRRITCKGYRGEVSELTRTRRGSHWPLPVESSEGAPSTPRAPVCSTAAPRECQVDPPPERRGEEGPEPLPDRLAHGVPCVSDTGKSLSVTSASARFRAWASGTSCVPGSKASSARPGKIAVRGRRVPRLSACSLASGSLWFTTQPRYPTSERRRQRPFWSRCNAVKAFSKRYSNREARARG